MSVQVPHAGYCCSITVTVVLRQHGSVTQQSNNAVAETSVLSKILDLYLKCAIQWRNVHHKTHCCIQVMMNVLLSMSTYFNDVYLIRKMSDKDKMCHTSLAVVIKRSVTSASLRSTNLWSCHTG